MRESLRSRRVAELLKKEISAIIANSVHDPKVHDVVITGVQVTMDMETARIYFTSYNKSILSDIKAGLERSVGFIRRELIKSLRMKKVPKPEFYIDETSEEADKIDALIEQLNDNQ